MSGYFQAYRYTYNEGTGVLQSYDDYAYGSYTLDSLVVSEVAPIPLPASLPLILAALGGLAGLRQFGRRKLNAV